MHLLMMRAGMQSPIKYNPRMRGRSSLTYIIIITDICGGMDAAAAIAKELMTLNSSVPVGRRTLAEHMDSGDLTYRTRDGHTLSMTEEEVRMLADVCGLRETVSLRLPILVGTDTVGEGSWAVDGKAEAKAVAALLGKPQPRDDRLRLHTPDLRRLTKMLPNAVFIVFTP